MVCAQLLLVILIALWTSLKLLDKVQKIINSLALPTDLGSFAQTCLTDTTTIKGADMRVLWQAVIPALMTPELVPDPVLRHMVLTFCEAIRVIDQPTITRAQIAESHQLLGAFVELFAESQGRAAVTPNMHLHGHLGQNMSDYGPLSQFETLPVERMCREAKASNTNGREIPMTHMRYWLHKDMVLRPEAWLEGAEHMNDEQRALHREIVGACEPDEEDVAGQSASPCVSLFG